MRNSPNLPRDIEEADHVLSFRAHLATTTTDRGRDGGISATPPSEPDRRISRIRLSSQWVRNATVVRVHSCSASKQSSPRWANHLRFAGSPEVSRVNMRSVQTQRSTHHHWSRASSACIGVAATLVDFPSLFCSIAHPLSCVPWLHGRYPLPRYYGRSDSHRAALRACAVNTA